MTVRRHGDNQISELINEFDPIATGQYVGNMARNAWDYAMERGDFSKPKGFKKLKGEDSQYMEADSTSDQAGNSNSINVNSSMGLSNGSGPGYRGVYTGNMGAQPGYEKWYHENIELHSKKIRSDTLLWGFSRWPRLDDISGQTFRIKAFGTTGVGGKAKPGSVYVSTGDFFGSQTDFFQPYGSNYSKFQMSDYIYSNSINPQLRDFVDNKVFSDSGNKGLMTLYTKFRLKSFTVTITPCSQTGGAFYEAPWVLYGNTNNSTGWPPNADFKTNNKHTKNDMSNHQDYWVYRDSQGLYATGNSNILTVPTDALATTTSRDRVGRETYTIRNFDSNLCIVNDKTPFSFTRQINPQGNYYMDKATILSLLNTNIAVVVNQLEGQTASSVAKPLPEYFNFLIAPINPVIGWVGETSGNTDDFGYIPVVLLTTKLHIKYQAKWEAFDYDYLATPFTTYTETYLDPLQMAEIEYKNNKLVQDAQLNKNV